MITVDARSGRAAVYVRINDVPVRLLAMTDLGQKGAVIFPAHSKNAELDGRRDLRISEEHLTIRLNRNPNHLFVHHTVQIDDPDIWKIDRVHIVNNEQTSAFATIYAMAITRSFDEPRKPTKIKPK